MDPPLLARPRVLAWAIGGAAAVGAVMLCLGGVVATAAVLAALALFAGPGFFLWRIVAPRDGGDAFERAIVGALVGIGLSATVTVVLALAIGLRPVPIAVTLVGLTALPAIAGWRRSRAAAPPAAGSGAAAMAAVFSVATAAALALPFAWFGRVTRAGIEFSLLQKTDLLHHMVTASEVARSIPPLNPYFSGETLHYFWWAHVLPAVALGLSGHRAAPRDVIVLTALAYSILAVLALLAALRAMHADRRVQWLLMTVAAFAPGYTDALALLRWAIDMSAGGSASLLRRLLTDDWGSAYTGYSHGLFRTFLVEPHATLALAMLATLLTLGVRYGFFSAPGRVALAQGALLGWILATDTFVGMLIGAAWGAGAVREIALGADRRPRAVRALLAVAATAAPIAALMLILHMVQLGERTLAIKPYTTLILLSPVYFALDYGPLAAIGLFGVIAAVHRWKARDDTARFLVILIAVCLAAMFFLTHVQVGTQVFRKASLALRLPLVAVSGWAVAELLARRRVWLWRILVIGVAAAIPSTATDIGRITRLGPVPDDLYLVRQDDLDAYRWMKQNLPPAALVQEIPGEGSGVVAFAERRTALGDWVHAANYQIGEERVAERHRDVYRTLFLGTDARRAREVAEKYGIAYVYVGRDAREKSSPDALLKFDRCPGSFVPVYRGDHVTVYRVLRAPAAESPGC